MTFVGFTITAITINYTLTIASFDQKINKMDTKTIATPEDWNNLWANKITPWDKGASSGALVQLLEENPIGEGKVLVPGCGRGYDCVLLATVPQKDSTESKRQVIGLDVSEIAVQSARDWVKDNDQIPTGVKERVSFLLDNFFTFEVPQNGFDTIFDYTFLCALQPPLRKEWAARMASLLSDGGQLITLMYPLEEKEGGPPFSLSVELYSELLEPQGLKRIVFQKPAPGRSHISREGKEMIAIWKKG
eukprot:TRINITY_DN1228_c0_g2_i1.p1 TRINITY_DN1228_c0_g2~~TRINITY_DN1228_c0_g2_i1.p1  ORF type:complete len:247 (-),score=82.80 TRINITY_DN1228_c0_g2_i1:545-1285(-)